MPVDGRQRGRFVNLRLRLAFASFPVAVNFRGCDLLLALFGLRRGFLNRGLRGGWGAQLIQRVAEHFGDEARKSALFLFKRRKRRGWRLRLRVQRLLFELQPQKPRCGLRRGTWFRRERRLGLPDGLVGFRDSFPPGRDAQVIFYSRRLADAFRQLTDIVQFLKRLFAANIPENFDAVGREQRLADGDATILVVLVPTVNILSGKNLLREFRGFSRLARDGKKLLNRAVLANRIAQRCRSAILKTSRKVKSSGIPPSLAQAT